METRRRLTTSPETPLSTRAVREQAASLPYPPEGVYDECTTREQHAAALTTIPMVAKPSHDPVYGADGPLIAQ